MSTASVLICSLFFRCGFGHIAYAFVSFLLEHANWVKTSKPCFVVAQPWPTCKIQKQIKNDWFSLFVEVVQSRIMNQQKPENARSCHVCLNYFLIRNQSCIIIHDEVTKAELHFVLAAQPPCPSCIRENRTLNPASLPFAARTPQ